MADEFNDALVSRCAACVAADSIACCDAAIEALLAAIARQARSDPQRRGVLVDRQWIESLPTELQHLMRPLGAALHAWYEADFSTAAARLTAIGQSVPCSPPRKPIFGPVLRCQMFSWAAACHTRTSAFAQARRLLARGRGSLTPDDAPHTLAWWHTERGRLAYWTDDVDAARDEYAQAEALFSVVDNRPGLVEVVDARTRLLTHEGLYEAALAELSRTRGWHEPDDLLGAAQAAFYTARIFRYRQCYDKALEALATALENVLEVRNTRWEATVRDVRGDIFLLTGRIRDAENEFSAPVFRRSNDPVVLERTQYQQAKLQFATAVAMRGSMRRCRVLEAVLATCEQLAEAATILMLREKSLVLAGRVQLALEDPVAAARSFETAARGFNRRMARWYRAEALELAGEAWLAAGHTAKAAQAWLSSLRWAVDAIQHRRIVTHFQQHWQAVGTEQICLRLVELHEQGRLLEETLASQERAAAQYLDSARRLSFAADRHLIHGELAAEESSPPSETTASQSTASQGNGLAVARHIAAARSLLEQQRFLLRDAQAASANFGWTRLAELIEDAGGQYLSPHALRLLGRRPEMGVVCDRLALTHAMRTILEVMHGWLQQATTRCALLRPARKALVVVRGRGPGVDGGSPSDLLEFSELIQPPLEQFQLPVDAWSKLVSQTAYACSCGAKVRLGTLGDRGKATTRYCLEIELPVEEMPLNLTADAPV